MTPSLLLLTPSRGLGGGIEQVANAIERVWPARVSRVDLYRREHTSVDRGQPTAKGGFALRAFATAMRERPHVVLALHVGLLPIAHAIAGVASSQAVLFGMGVEVWGPMRATRRLLIRRCAGLLAISGFTAEWMARRARVAEEQITVIPLTIDPELPGQTPFAGNPPQSPGASFVTVSRILSHTRYKGHYVVARALPLVLAERPDARWIVIGGGDDLDNLRAECKRLGVGHAVEFRGKVDTSALADAYREALFHVLPSIADPEAEPPTGEGLGLVYLEAAMFGLPSIGSQAGGGGMDFVTHEVTGLTVPPEDHRALAAAIIRMLEDHDLRLRLGARSYALVQKRHLPEHFAAALESALRRHSGRGRARL